MKKSISFGGNSVLVIRSLALLGFSTAAYPALSILEILPSAFDRTNERLLLCLLHFLLTRLESSFSANVSSCWPYCETKEKNEFKRIVSAYIDGVSSKNSSITYSDFRSSILSVAKGPSVWSLLKRLSDAVLDLTIEALMLRNQNQATIAVSIQKSAGFWSTLASTNTDELKTAIKAEYASTLREGKNCTTRQNDQTEFSVELNERLKVANKGITEAAKTMEVLSLSDKKRFLTESAQIERSELVQRIKEMYNAFKLLSASSAFVESGSVMNFYSGAMEHKETFRESREMFSAPVDSHKPNIRHFGDEDGQVSSSSSWHLDYEPLEPLSAIMEGYSAAAKAKFAKHGEETFLLGAVRNEDEGQEIEATAERADETLQAMRILEKKSQDLRAKILGAIELI